ncbi:MAG: HAD family hydrolase [Gemmataceae bacterium]
MKPAIFLDRDGTLIVDPGYPKDPEVVQPLPGVVEALMRFGDAGFALVVISNQAGVGRGIITPKQARAVHLRFIALFGEKGIHFDDVRYCFHAPEVGCACRKPAPGMILQSTATYGWDLPRSYMIGDKPSDVQAGIAAGCVGIAFTDWPSVTARILG